jgi:MFS transporter, OFA family, oxalate/formate antiporter
MSQQAALAPDPMMKKRWWILAALVVSMMSIANFQYAWTMFTTPLQDNFKASLAAVQVAFTAFVMVQTWLVPVEALLVDKYGTRIVMTVAGLIVGISWVWSGMATSLPMLIGAYAFGGIGVGAVYGASIGAATKWFPDHRGLCVGAVAGSYGFGTALTVIPIANMIQNSGYQQTFITFGIIQGVLVFLAAQFIRLPAIGWKPQGWVPQVNNKGVVQSARSSTPAEMMRTGPFYVLYIMMTMVAFGGLMVTAQLKPIGVSYGYDKVIIIGTTSAVTLALMLDRILNGFTRPMWGWISDHIGRYNTMTLAFSLEACAIVILTLTIKNPAAFVIMSGMTFFAWGEIYSLFPAAITDIYGPKYATTNYGIQYTSKGIASLLAGPGAALLMAAAGSWLPVLYTAAAMDLTAAILAVVWLKPMVTKLIRERSQAEAGLAKAAGD